MFTGLLYAADATPKAAPPVGGMLIPLVFAFIVIYLMIIRPQQKKSKEHQKMVDGLQKGAQVLTSGGIFGTVVALKGNVVELKVADDVKISVAKSAVTTVIKEDKEQPANTPQVR